MLLDRVAPGGAHDARTASSCCSPTRTASRWDRALIAEGQALVRRCLRRGQPGPVPDPGGDQRGPQRARRGRTDWRQIVALYDQLLAIAPTPDRRAEPRGRRGRGRRAGGGAWRSSTGSTLERYHLLPRASAPTCCGGWAATARRRRRTRPRSPSPRTPPRASSSPGGSRRSDDARFIRRVNRSGDGPHRPRRAC